MSPPEQDSATERTTAWSTACLLALLLGFAVLLNGCGSPLRTQRVGIGGYGNLRLELQVDNPNPRVGDALKIRYTVSNVGPRPQSVVSERTPVLDIEVRPVGSGAVLLSWAAQNPDRVMHRLALQPNESVSLDLVWMVQGQDLSPGMQVYVSGLLHDDASPGGAGAGVTVCIEYCKVP